MTNYRPLPTFLTVKKSKIEGLGLFARSRIKEDEILGITHWKNGETFKEFIRTPLGGFINHSENPNCEILDTGKYYVLHTIRSIKRGEELTLKYSWYNPEEE